jgi:cellulose synthase/poly-beta-1,6-N-acetylglucosamine synthase-like glycosyltransferase
MTEPAMTSWPRTSVIVAAYNAEETIGACLESLLELDYPLARHEIIIVDNASQDATPTILGAYSRRITVLREERKGPAAARNTGVRRATGDVVAFTDSDCVVDRQWLRCLVAPLADSTVGVVGGRNRARQPCNAIAAFGERIHDHRRAIEDLVPPYAITMNWSSRLSVLHEVGLFDPDLLRCQDVDLAYRLIQGGYRLVYEPNAVVYHRNRSSLPALMRQGYQHGYHAVRIRRLHAAFLSAYRRRSRFQPASAVVAFAGRVAAAGARNVPWALCFELAKRAGHLHGILSTTAADARRGPKDLASRAHRRTIG